jgi:hypothetical protein
VLAVASVCVGLPRGGVGLAWRASSLAVARVSPARTRTHRVCVTRSTHTKRPSLAPTRYIRRQFRSLPSFRLSQLSPRPATLAAFVCAGLAALASQRAFMSGVSGGTHTQREFLRAALRHVGVGAALLAGLAVLMYRTERDTLRGLKALSAERRGASQAEGAKEKDQ